MHSDDKKTEYHNIRMARKKAQIDAAIARADQKKGLLLVITGNGKGKSTSAFGMVARALGHGMKVGVCQFIKSRTDTGEEAFFSQLPNCEWHVLGDGFTWDTQDREQDIATSKRGWQVAMKMLTDPSYDLVVLDELTYLLSYDYLDKDEVLNGLSQKPEMQHVVVTGRSAIAPLRELADTVSDIKDEKHAYKAGIQAQKGIDL
ncbi:cob(I)yrinic acid a,c-diamide adenosyltransferase [Thiomicrospira cyclica]|uniref:Corrinoid adenosyltransferase n=1 Tax=Thiomicrospira cyclica (strain DSM 14477 / JCM 11371 / ALM1) TaxID=717773 RepID=F6DBV8_THICA|nr:cob(I)yrinic acid a,c-diamide adenosyltransferase [Thiomicrospira cyclica]AEG31344.1 cob(I)alamin adenosyltransferase [Thiomicrospira cyclica ALM1]